MTLSSLGSTSKAGIVMLTEPNITSPPPAPETPSRFFASWNLLNDQDVPDDYAQHMRLPTQAALIKSLNDGKGPDIFFGCEGVSAYNLSELADQAEMELAIIPNQYSPHEWMGFAVRPGLPEVEVEFVNYRHRSDQVGFMMLKQAGVTYVGAHYGHRIVRDWWSRNRATAAILDAVGPLSETPAVIAGDFNDLPYGASRLGYLANGLRELHKGERPKFPHEPLRGISVHRRVPSMNLDGIYVTKHLSVGKVGAVYNDGSDHPLLYAGW